MPRRKKLITRLFPAFLLITFASLFLVTWYVLSALHNFFIDQTREELVARAHLIRYYITAQSIPIDIPSIDRLCKKAGKTSQTRITVIRPTGEVLGDTDKDPRFLDNHAKRPEIIDAVQSGMGSAVRYSNTVKKQMMYVAVPIKNKRQVTLIIRASTPLSSVYGALGTIKAQIVGAGLFVALLVIFASFFVSRRIVQPIQDMKTGAQRFAAGDLDRKLAIPDTEELAGLATALNDMAKELSENIKTIKRQKHELETVFASMTEAVVAIDNDEKILRINQAAEYFLGHPEAAIQGKYLYAVIRNHEFIKFTEIAAATNTAKTTEEDILFEINENHYTVNTKSAPLIDETHQRIGTLLVLNDVTRVRQLENMRKEFAANVSHEIKTPLTSIQGFAEELMAIPVITENQETKRYLEIISKNARRLSAIVEDVLRLSNIEHGNRQKDFHFEETKLAAVIDSAINICKPEADSKEMQIMTDCDATLIACLDFSLMEQALVNLLSNAIKYSPDSSRVQITATADDKNIFMQIIDAGLGIEESHVPRLFERFYRVDKARSRKLGGTGLGLAIVKHVVQIHGGKIDVQSTPGQGSTFTVTLPRA